MKRKICALFCAAFAWIGVSAAGRALDESEILIREGNLEAARSILSPLVEKRPEHARAQLLLGLTFYRQHRYEEARSCFEQAVLLEPDGQPARLYLGWALYNLGELDASRAVFVSLAEMRPGDPEVDFALGLIDFDEDRTDGALERFSRAARAARRSGDDTTEAKARARLADVWMRRDEWEKARDELRRSVELNPRNHEAFYKLSRVLRRLGDAAGAEAAAASYDALLAGTR